MRAPGYSLWLVPGGEIRTRLAARIQSLARLLGTPAFGPHVTLLGGVEGPERDVRTASAELALLLSPLAIRLGPADTRDDYFHCVFVRVEDATPTNQALRAAHATAREGLKAGGAEFMPHLSLVYGNLSTSARATALRDAAGVCGESFVVRRLELVRTEGEVREWKVVEAWRLRSPRRTRGAEGG